MVQLALKSRCLGELTCRASKPVSGHRNQPWRHHQAPAPCSSFPCRASKHLALHAIAAALPTASRAGNQPTTSAPRCRRGSFTGRGARRTRRRGLGGCGAPWPAWAGGGQSRSSWPCTRYSPAAGRRRRASGKRASSWAASACSLTCPASSTTAENVILFCNEWQNLRVKLC